MDKTDMSLIRALWEDSRISFNQLGKNLDISGNILKKRAEKLEEEGVFVYHSNPVFSQFRYGRIVFSAIIPKDKRNDYIDLISNNFQEIYEIIFTLDERCVIVILLPFDSKEGVSEETIVEFKERFYSKIDGVKLMDYYKMTYLFGEKPKLKPMELELIRLLRKNSRRDLINLSQKLDLSKKTLSRYLQKFTQNRLVVHTIGLQPNKIKNFIIHIVFITLKENENLEKNTEFLKESIKTWISYYKFRKSAGTSGDGIAFYVYTDTLAEMEEKIRSIIEMPNVKKVDKFFPSEIVRFEKWKELVIPTALNTD